MTVFLLAEDKFTKEHTAVTLDAWKSADFSHFILYAYHDGDEKPYLCIREGVDHIRITSGSQARMTDKSKHFTQNRRECVMELVRDLASDAQQLRGLEGWY